MPVVGALSASHAPGILGWPGDVTAEEHAAVFAAYDELKKTVAQAQADVIIAFLDDHFENHFRNLMPSVSIGVAEQHTGPGEHLLELLKFDEVQTFGGEKDLAEHILRTLVGSGIDAARMSSAEFGNNLMVPMKLLRPEGDIPIIPVYINVFTPPLITMKRAYQVGAAVRAAVENGDKRIMFWGTGGLSHWPPIWEPSREPDDFLARMKTFQNEGRGYLERDPDLWTDIGPYEIKMAEEMGDACVNPEWDQEFLKLLSAGDMQTLFSWTYDDVEKCGGHGGHEILNWMAVAGAMGGAPCEVLTYQPTPAWICGTGAVRYTV
ncbi:DODA-type extradiol aromatic ring-opening family dioxygenase [Mycolicibacterium baixiangningiae]|uniref:DODA-type extradiol aromatic ring-opening family dioxygenase n=1 Tax=Mycolicibacterium baixiangningiae TaxID=2761578 RepID=UPI001865A964|nr:extradiol dioxygenase [Mycolicibacterium baixiangningiae]